MHIYGIIILYDNNNTRKIIVKENNYLSIRIITLNSLKKEIEFFTPKPFIYFIENELNENSNKKSTMAVIIKNKLNENILKYFSFNNSINERENDIPFFHPDVPDGYSFFCSQFEYIQLMEFLKKNEKKYKKEEEESLEVDPIPRRKNFLCQICKIKFGNYIEHINSSLHSHNKLKYKNIFKKIQNTFKRIVDNNEQEKKDILDSIDSKSKNIPFCFGKRKKNEKNKSFFKDNYIYDLQKVTGKIYHYKNLFNK